MPLVNVVYMHIESPQSIGLWFIPLIYSTIIIFAR